MLPAMTPCPCGKYKVSPLSVVCAVSPDFYQLAVQIQLSDIEISINNNSKPNIKI